MKQALNKPGNSIINILFIFTVLNASLLFFVIQPMIGKIVLPILGGSSSVWSTVMLFFTTILLLGYLYVVWITKKTRKYQVIIHGTIIFMTIVWTIINFVFIHSLFVNNGAVSGNQSPAITLFLNMIKTIGLPCFLLASTSPLLQSWYPIIFEGKSPYWLYIVSNFGSLLGLLIYPFVVEKHLSLNSQQSLWLWGLGIYLTVIVWVIVVVSKRMSSFLIEKIDKKPKGSVIFYWFIFPFISTASMLAFTSQLTLSVSPYPLMWVATLGIYLLTYILAFIDKDWYVSDFFGFIVLTIIILLSLFSFGFVTIEYRSYVMLMFTGLFFISLMCNRELFKRRPEASGSSIFYVMVGLGGVAASVFVSLVAPSIFNDIWEYPLALIASAIAAIFVLYQNKSRLFKIYIISYGFLVVLFTVWRFENPLESEIYKPNTVILASLRNYYGIHHILKTPINGGNKITLMSGETIHGMQYFVNKEEFIPTVYFSKDNGIGYAIENHPKRVDKLPIKIGVIGLGSGTIASYCGKGDSIFYFEINPQVIEISQTYFKFLENARKSGCDVNIVQGDGRLSLVNDMDKIADTNFDIFVVDAFSDDSIPVHLITNEAIQLYISKLNESGVLTFHISNRYLDLAPVLEALAAKNRLYFNHIQKTANWVLLSNMSTGSESYIPKYQDENKLWTDDYSNIVGVIMK